MPTHKSVLANFAHLKQSVAILGQGNLADIPEKSYPKRSLTFESPALRTSARCGGVGGEMPDGIMLSGIAAAGSGRAAGDFPPESHKDCRTRLVALLLNFMKQYYLAGFDDAIRAMLQDICREGRCPRRLGRWGLLGAQEVDGQRRRAQEC